jgi:lipoprotein NlpI
MFQEEEGDFRKAMELQPKNVNILYHLGLLCEKQERLKEAMQLFNDVIEIDAGFAPAYNARGMVFDKQENYQASYLEFSRAIELDPANAVSYHNRACCLKNMGRY